MYAYYHAGLDGCRLISFGVVSPS